MDYHVSGGFEQKNISLWRHELGDIFDIALATFYRYSVFTKTLYYV